MRLIKRACRLVIFLVVPLGSLREYTGYVASSLKPWPKVGTASGERRAGAASVTAGPVSENTHRWDNQAGLQRGPGQRTEFPLSLTPLLCVKVQNKPSFHNVPAFFSHPRKMECAFLVLSLSPSFLQLLV